MSALGRVRSGRFFTFRCLADPADDRPEQFAVGRSRTMAPKILRAFLHRDDLQVRIPKSEPFHAYRQPVRYNLTSGRRSHAAAP